jgi:glycosyltransferase involved in cell wall biosynthesis
MMESGELNEDYDNIDALARLFNAFDEDYYLEQVGNIHSQASLKHYLETGWRRGFEPVRHFDSKFLLPYFDTIAEQRAPALTWIELSSMTGFPALTNEADAEAMARRIRNSAMFDGAWYARRLPEGLDAALHYVIVGERMGWRPSSAFDPSFYLDRYPDVAQLGLSPLWHYETSGRKEGRRPVSVADRLEFPPILKGTKPRVLLICHDASRSGAPVLGWNLARGLAEKYDIVSVIMHGGPLERNFSETCAAFVGPMTWDDWHPAEMQRVADRLVATYKPFYAIANSVETHILTPPLVALGVPAVALVHEFAAYTRPVSRMRDTFDWATHVVFPAKIVADSSFRAFQDLRTRNDLHLLPQGRATLPESKAIDTIDANEAPRLRSSGEEDAFVLLGAGSVEIRKGVDLFISAAAIAKRLRPDIKFRFVWIGHGFDPVNDTAYSVYLAEQIVQSNLADNFAVLQPVANLDAIYAQADAFFMCSRLDPQPNVGIDAITRGIPTICFEGSSGTAEILGADPATRHLVVPHLDCHLAAEVLCEIANSRDQLGPLRADIARVGRDAFDMARYIDQIDEFGRDASRRLNDADVRLLQEKNIVESAMFLPPDSTPVLPGELERLAILRLEMWDTPEGSLKNPLFRRPCAGFHPQIYAQANAAACIDMRRNPLVHWVENECPSGPWSRSVFGPENTFSKLKSTSTSRVALHGHFYYPELAADLRKRLSKNSTVPDLYLSTESEAKSTTLSAIFLGYRGRVQIRTFPNKGRDLGPFLSGFHEALFGGNYDVVGHIHGKKSLDLDAAMGETWRNFLWDNLIGGAHVMMDIAIRAFENDPTVGLLHAEDPHLVAWSDNRDVAETLAERMRLSTPLADFFDFPLGTMFWARPAALRPIIDLGLTWNDFPPEPLAYDGTLLHALERLLPFVAKETGFSVGGLRAPGSTW